jgi:uncharacterized membrane protein YhaH (DUF805 family)
LPIPTFVPYTSITINAVRDVSKAGLWRLLALKIKDIAA